ncbi:MAG: glycoside hydrolase family 36 protein [Treponemataceae bacterium]
MIKEFFARCDFTATENTILETYKINDLLKNEENKDLQSKNSVPRNFTGTNFSSENAWINLGGWQSWSPCFEIEPGKEQPNLSKGFTKTLTKVFKNILQFPETKFISSKNIVLAQFVCYLRWEDFYLVLASTGTIIGEKSKKPMPPVQFIIDRKKNTVTIEICDKGKSWKQGDLQSQIHIFTANSYFDCKDSLKKIFDCNQFKNLEFLTGQNRNEHSPSEKNLPTNRILGWESWYNHYTQIHENLILEDLEALHNTENILNFLKSNYNEQTPIIFQIDDGWENMVGDWTINKTKFPNGLQYLAEKIENALYIPGLWIAPFLVYKENPVAKNHPEWLLKNHKGKLIAAGINPGWNGLKNYYFLDLSREDVLNYLDKIMETAINQWGFRYLKLDFMYAGMIYGNFSNGGASFEWYSKAIKILTKRTKTKDGKPVTYLGCGIPMEQSFVDFPISRIGCDTYEHWQNKFMRKLNWQGRNEAFLNLKNTLGRALWDKTIFVNDPDVIFIRNKNCSLTKDEKILISLVNFIFGSQIMYSDDPANSNSQEEIELAREISKLCKTIQQEEFGIKPVGNEEYLIFSKSKKFKGKICLGEKHKITLEKAKIRKPSVKLNE